LGSCAGSGGAGLRLFGGATARIQQSLPLSGGVDGTGLVQTPGIVIEDPSSSAAFEPFAFPTLATTAPQVALGSTLHVALDGHAGGLAMLFAALASGPTLALPGVEGLGLLDLGALIQVAGLVLDPAGGGVLGVPVPPVAELLGTAFHLQAVELSGAGLALTNPALATATL
jgi:hypothetical protein